MSRNEWRLEYEREQRSRRGWRCLGCVLVILSGVAMAVFAWVVLIVFLTAFGL